MDGKEPVHMENQRSILQTYALEHRPRPGEREIRMRPAPLEKQSRPRAGGMPNV